MADRIELRLVKNADQYLILAWRNDPEIMRWLPSAPKRLTWAEHMGWWKQKGAENRYWMVKYTEHDILNPRPIGVVHCSWYTGEVGIIIGEKTLWGLGLGTRAMKLMLERVDSMIENGEAKSLAVWAVVHPENIPSLKLFEACGFSRTEEPGRNGQVKLVRRTT